MSGRRWLQVAASFFYLMGSILFFISSITPEKP